MSHQLVLTTFLPFVQTTRRSYRLNGSVKYSDHNEVGGSLLFISCEIYWSLSFEEWEVVTKFPYANMGKIHCWNLSNKTTREPVATLRGGGASSSCASEIGKHLCFLADQPSLTRFAPSNFNQRVPLVTSQRDEGGTMGPDVNLPWANACAWPKNESSSTSAMTIGSW